MTTCRYVENFGFSQSVEFFWKLNAFFKMNMHCIAKPWKSLKNTAKNEGRHCLRKIDLINFSVFTISIVL